jgi:hypothetical protein
MPKLARIVVVLARVASVAAVVSIAAMATSGCLLDGSPEKEHAVAIGDQAGARAQLVGGNAGAPGVGGALGRPAPSSALPVPLPALSAILP